MRLSNQQFTRGKEVAKMKFAGFWIFLVGMALLLDPQCKGGCRTIAEHLVTHGLDRL
jgi:hypothetical protein